MRAFEAISQGNRMPGLTAGSRGRVKNLIVPRDRARQEVLYVDARFDQVAGFPVRW